MAAPTLRIDPPAVRLVPREALARAHRRILRTSPRTRLDYGGPRGEGTLRPP